MFKKFGDTQSIGSIILPTDIDVKSVAKKMKTVKEKMAKISEMFGEPVLVEETTESTEDMAKAKKELDIETK